MKTMIGVASIIVLVSTLAACSPVQYCPNASQLLDIAGRAYSGRDDGALDAWMIIPERCKRCRLAQVTEKNNAMRRIGGQCEGIGLESP